MQDLFMNASPADLDRLVGAVNFARLHPWFQRMLAACRVTPGVSIIELVEGSEWQFRETREGLRLDEIVFQTQSLRLPCNVVDLASIADHALCGELVTPLGRSVVLPKAYVLKQDRRYDPATAAISVVLIPLRDPAVSDLFPRRPIQPRKRSIDPVFLASEIYVGHMSDPSVRPTTHASEAFNGKITTVAMAKEAGFAFARLV